MFILQHELRNYKQHTKKTMKFDGNVVGIVGRNGVGKSNLLGSLQFALTGEQPGFVKKDLLQWGAATGSVETAFRHNDVDCIIYRALHSSEVRFEYGQDRYRTAATAQEALRQLVGIDRDVCRQTLFARQAEIDAVLFTDPRVRELGFQKLCGMGDTAKIHKSLGEKLASMQQPPNYDEQIAGGRQHQQELQGRLDSLKTTHQDSVAKRRQCPDIAQIKTQIAQLEGTLHRTRQHQDITRQLAEYIADKQRNEAKLAGLPECTGDTEQLTRQLQELQRLRDTAQQYSQCYMAWQEAVNTIEKLGTAPTTPEHIKELEQQAKQLAQQYNKLGGELNLYCTLRKSLKEFPAEQHACPVCGHDIDDGAALMTRLDGRIAQLQDSMKPLDPDGDQRRIKTLSISLIQYDANRKACETRVAQSTKALEAAPKVEQSLQDIEAAIDYTRKSLDQHLFSIKTRTQLTANIKSIAQITAQLTCTADKLVQEGIEQHDIACITTKLDQLKAMEDSIITMDRDIARLTGTIQELEHNMRELDTTITQLEQKRANQGNYRKAIQTLTEVRDWFHYSNGPHTVAAAVLQDMVVDLNTFLGYFSAPFTAVCADEGLGFSCMFTDGRSMPQDGPPDAQHLSGGQKIQLAISFRLASYCMFANRLGLLSLDEPTVFLDQQNIDNFCKLLERLRIVAKNMNLQVFLATHETATMQFMDSVITLDN